MPSRKEYYMVIRNVYIESFHINRGNPPHIKNNFGRTPPNGNDSIGKDRVGRKLWDLKYALPSIHPPPNIMR